jgi:prephenate dehydratase
VTTSPFRLRVTFQGAPGAFSEDAAIKLLGPGIDLVPRSTFAALVSSLEERSADYALLPVENSIIGLVQPAVDLLCESGLIIIDELTLRIEQHLIGCPGSRFEEIEAVESQKPALDQCRRFFEEHPRIMRIESDDTAGSVASIVDCGDRSRAAIASRRAAEIYGGLILKENLEDHPDNHTRFLLLSRNHNTETTRNTNHDSQHVISSNY